MCGIYTVVYSILSQNKEGILPVVTLSIALYVPRRSRSESDVVPEVCNFFTSFMNINKYCQLPRTTGLAHALNILQQDEIPILGHAKS